MSKDIANQVNKIIDSIDFTAIWPDFEPHPFAIEQYWSDAHYDPQLLAARAVHNMFRDYLQQLGDMRQPDEVLLGVYPHDLDNYRLKLAENHFLTRAVTDNSMMDLQQFVVLREARRRILGEAMLQEQIAETAYGLAEYAGLAALNQICRAKFMEELQGHLTILRNPRYLFDIRLVSRSVGCLICFALRSLGINFYHSLPESRTIYDHIPQIPNEIDEIFNELEKNGIYSQDRKPGIRI